MVAELSEKEILDYLMTSDFQEGLTAEEMRFLLFQFRNFFRIISGKNDLFKSELDGKIKELQDQKSIHESVVQKLTTEKQQAVDELKQLVNRKLTFKERLSGKINH